MTKLRSLLLLALLVSVSHASLIDSVSDALTPIKHIVVLMMENRSFDHLLGWLMTDYTSRIDGLKPGTSMPRDPRNPGLGSVPITRGGYDVAPCDPHHDFAATHQQIDGGAMDGFVWNTRSLGLNESNPVSMFDSNSAPVINTLARQFAVFDRWFASIPGPTDPNREYAMSGTSVGMLNNYNGSRWPQQSYFDLLRRHNRTFGAYYQDNLWAIGDFADMHLPENKQHIFHLNQFFEDAKNGTLPQYSWLQPRMTVQPDGSLPTWQHPDASVREGERLIKQVFEALRASPLWSSTLFLLTYDEHGGFADHVTPPSKNVPNPDGVNAPNGFKFDRLGVRVPMLAISPWIDAGTVVSGPLPGEQPTPDSQFDSTSIIATVHRLLGLQAEGVPLPGKRAAWANSFAGLVQKRTSPREDCPEVLPEVPPSAADAAERQRQLPLNEHLTAEIDFYCVENRHGVEATAADFERSPSVQEVEAALASCEARDALLTQGQASEWLMQQHDLFWTRRGRTPPK